MSLYKLSIGLLAGLLATSGHAALSERQANELKKVLLCDQPSAANAWAAVTRAKKGGRSRTDEPLWTLKDSILLEGFYITEITVNGSLRSEDLMISYEIDASPDRMARAMNIKSSNGVGSGRSKAYIQDGGNLERDGYMLVKTIRGSSFLTTVTCSYEFSR